MWPNVRLFGDLGQERSVNTRAICSVAFSGSDMREIGVLHYTTN